MPPTGTCYHCGGKHSQLTCHFKSEVCHFCSKWGHIAKVCRSRTAQSSQNKASTLVDSSKPTHQATEDLCDTESSEYSLLTLPNHQTKPLQADVEVEEHNLNNMEINTGVH